MPTIPPAPEISVIIPVHQGGEAFLACLQGLARLDPPPLETLVVVDGPDEASAQAAEAHGAQVLRSPVRGGPAKARNTGARVARGGLLLFLDADVVPSPGLVGQVARAFQADPGLTALAGAYDDAPGATSFLSQYRNLLHAYVHQRAHGPIHSFWAACGALRREVFLDLGGFDETFTRPAIEDVELGYRLARAGYRTRLDARIQVKHLKHWSAGTMLRTDIVHRAIPWTRLLLKEGRIRGELNLGPESRASAVVAWLLLACLLCAWLWPRALLAAALLILALFWLNADFYRFLKRRRGLWFVLWALPWHWLYYLYASAAFGYVLIIEYPFWTWTRSQANAAHE